MAAGINVVYLEPYPKSRAEKMYSGPMKFQPFVGISPKRYDTLFRVTVDRKDKQGAMTSWGDEERMSALPKLGNYAEYVGLESEREETAIAKLLTAAKKETQEKSEERVDV